MIYLDQKIVVLVRLYVKIEVELGEDGNLYYIFKYSIEVTYLSGMTRYKLLHKGKLTQSPSKDVF